jgi:tRNA A37 threonylcarbamoyladenosine biosynthesis protein TsaE
VINMKDSRINAGVLLAPTGAGGDHLTPAAAKMVALRSTTFDKMKTPTFVITGSKDDSTYMTSRGPIYHADPYYLSAGPKSLLTLIDGEHMLGGVTGYDAKGTTDENVERVALAERR